MPGAARLRRRSIGNGAPQPPSIPSAVAVWWADDLGLVNGASVTSWVDRVGSLDAESGVSAIPTFNATGINGKPTVDFFEDILVVTATSPFSSITSGCVVAVVEIGGLGSSGVWASSDEATPNNYLLGVSVGGDIRMQVNPGAFGADYAYTTVSPPVTHAIEWVSTGAAWQIRLDNAAQTLTTVGTNTGDWFDDVSGRDNFTIGASRRFGEGTGANFLDGKIAFLMVTDGELTTQERSDLYEWISTYYGITVA